MIDAEKHTAQIAKLDTTRILGARAAETLHQMQPVFDEMRDIYGLQLVENTKAQGKPDDYTTWCLVVLSDIEALLSEKAGRGARATRKLGEIQNAGGSKYD